MLRRNLRHMQRYPSLTLMLVGIPVIFLLMFVYVFGGTFGAGLGSTSEGRAEYVNYVASPLGSCSWPLPAWPRERRYRSLWT